MFTPVKENELKAAEINLCVMLVDDSGSINDNELMMVNAVNSAVDELISADGNRDKYWLGVSGFNHSFEKPMAAITPGHQVAIDEFKAGGGTPLYARTLEALRYLQSERERLALLGIKVRTAIIVLTDGLDSGHETREATELLKKLKPLALDMAQSPHHLLFGIGILTKAVRGHFPEHVRSSNPVGGLTGLIQGLWGSGKKVAQNPDDVLHETAYHHVFIDLMGFSGPNAVVIAANNSAAEVARAMRQASQSIARVGAGARPMVKSGF